jgi:filamentous hemagglutinin
MNPMGSWFTFEPPKSKTLTHIDGAVKTDWVDPITGGYDGHSTLNSVLSIELSPGQKFYYGPVGEQGGVHLGGRDRIQVHVPGASKNYQFKFEGDLP